MVDNYRRSDACRECLFVISACNIIDCDLLVRWHVTKTAHIASRYFVSFESLHRSVPSAVLQYLVVSLILKQLDYGDATLAGVPACQLEQLQSVMNTAAQLIYSSSK